MKKAFSVGLILLLFLHSISFTAQPDGSLFKRASESTQAGWRTVKTRAIRSQQEARRVAILIWNCVHNRCTLNERNEALKWLAGGATALVITTLIALGVLNRNRIADFTRDLTSFQRTSVSSEAMPTEVRQEAQTEQKDQESLNKELENALRLGDVNAARRAIEDGAAVNDKNRNEQNMLHRAVSYVKATPEIVQLLIEKGAPVNARDKSGNTALVYAIGSPDIMKALFAKGAAVDDSDIASKLLRSTISNISFSHDKQPEIEQYVSSLKLLLENGINPNVSNIDGLTPLYYLISFDGIDSEGKSSYKNPKIKDAAVMLLDARAQLAPAEYEKLSKDWQELIKRWQAGKRMQAVTTLLSIGRQ